MRKKTSAQIRRMEKRAAARGEEYTYVPPPPRPSADKPVEGKKKEEQRLGDLAKQLDKELKSIDEDSNLPSKDRRSAKRKAEAVAAEEAGMSRVEFLEWCETNKTTLQESTKKKSKNKKQKVDTVVEDPDALRRQAAEKLLAELQAIDGDQDLKSKDRRSAKRKAHAIATEESGMEAEQLLDWYNQNKK
jgi:hypothetical protein